VPSGDAGATALAWRRTHPDAVAAYNAARVLPWPLHKPYGYERQCLKCGLVERVRVGDTEPRCSACGGEPGAVPD
jgi:hypothetical protein